MPVLKITWYTYLDERTCNVCRPLDGYDWVFDTEKDTWPRILLHPEKGGVWDTILDQPTTHGDGVWLVHNWPAPGNGWLWWPPARSASSSLRSDC